MKELIIYNQEGKETGKVKLKSELWTGEVHSHALHLSLRQELSNRRAGTHSTKTRDEVSGTGKKPWKQKGTGRARSGSVRSPLWRHGGVIFGPHPRKHGFSLPRQVKSLGIASALRNLLADGRLAVLDSLEIPDFKTKHLAKVFRNLEANKTLVLTKGIDKKIERASRNLEKIKILPVARLNVHDLLRFEKVYVTKESLAMLEEAFA